MKPQTAELIKAEQRRSDFGFITEVVQRGRIKPAKYRHSLVMPLWLYEEMRDASRIVPEDYFIEEMAFFEFKEETATISFKYLYGCEDLHRRVLEYLVCKFAGSCPIYRVGVSKMNFDKVVEPVMTEKTKKMFNE